MTHLAAFSSDFLSHMSVNLEKGTQLIEFEGARLAFDFEPSATGSGSRRLLVLVNGYQRTRLDFRAFRKRLADVQPDTATLALDNRGCGETENSLSALTVEQMARDVALLSALFCRKLNLSRYSVLGISMGGMISQVLAAADTHVEKLILVSTTAGGHGRVWPPRVKPEEVEYRGWPEDEAGMTRRMQAYFGSRFMKQSPLLFKMMVSTMLKSAKKSAEPGRSALQFAASAGFDGTSVLGDIHARTLVVTGDEDHVIPMENAYYLQNNIPGSELIIYPQTGHLILIEEPEKFVADVARFLQGEGNS